MKRVVNVLVFPCGAENALEIHTALANVVNVVVFGASGRDDHGQFVFKNYIGGLPYLSSPEFITAFNEVLVTHSIDLVFPTHDDAAVFLAAHASTLCAKV